MQQTRIIMTTKEAYSVLESANFLRDLGEVQPMTPEDMETRRRIIDFVHELETARFMLAMSYKEPFLDLGLLPLARHTLLVCLSIPHAGCAYPTANYV